MNPKFSFVSHQDVFLKSTTFSHQSNLLSSGRKSGSSQTNGYSIAEILLVFVTIAGVIFVAWSVYTVLSVDSDVKTAVAEIHMLQQAGRQYKTANKNSYLGVSMANLTPYLGKGGLTDPDNNGFVSNFFGGRVGVHRSNTGDLSISYSSIPSLAVCQQILKHFGEIESTNTGFKIPPNKTITGFIGDDDQANSGCTPVDPYGEPLTWLSLRVD